MIYDVLMGPGQLMIILESYKHLIKGINLLRNLFYFRQT